MTYNSLLKDYCQLCQDNRNFRNNIVSERIRQLEGKLNHLRRNYDFLLKQLQERITCIFIIKKHILTSSSRESVVRFGSHKIHFVIHFCSYMDTPFSTEFSLVFIAFIFFSSYTCIFYISNIFNIMYLLLFLL